MYEWYYNKKNNLNQKGFTLVELLAVIVILALVTLITVPIVLNIINKVKINSYRRSIDLYGKAIQNAIIELESEKSENNNIVITFDAIENIIDYEGNDVECSIKQRYSDGTLFITKCKVNNEEIFAEKGKGYGSQNYYYYTNSINKINLIKYIELINDILNGNNNINSCIIESDNQIKCNGNTIKLQEILENAISGTLMIQNGKVISYINLKFKNQEDITSDEVVLLDIEELDSSNVLNENPTDENANTNNNNQNTNMNNNDNKPICKSSNGRLSFELGNKYLCQVSEKQKYYFYVLSLNKDDDTVNLIMDSNICEDGTVSNVSKPCTYSFRDRYSGPDIAFEVLYNATKKWNNVLDMKFTYIDERYSSGTYTCGISSCSSAKYTISYDDYLGKTLIVESTSMIPFIIETDSYSLKARLPKVSEIKNANNEKWLKTNLGNYGYWLLSTSPGGWYGYEGANNYTTYFKPSGIGYNRWNNGDIGVRAVITLAKSYLTN